MHSLTVGREFTAQHFLIGGDWGDENKWHSHVYKVEVTLEGAELDGHEYLVDIVEVDRRIDELVASVKDRTLNDLPEFSERNPSIELFAKVVHQRLAKHLAAPNLEAMSVTVWENDIARASFRAALAE